MKKKTILIAGVAAVLLLMAAVYLWAPGAAPAGQPPVLSLSEGNFAEFAKTFDAKADMPRLVFLLSPT
jgi:hypothetical protein